jgi:lysophospholipase L1-like esterase
VVIYQDEPREAGGYGPADGPGRSRAHLSGTALARLGLRRRRARSTAALGAAALVLGVGLTTGQFSTTAQAADPATGARTSSAAPVWVGTWGTVPTTVPVSAVRTFRNQTLREIVHVSLGGDRIRVRLSNEFGTQGLTVGEAHVARRAPGTSGGQTLPGSDRRLTFGRSSHVTVPAGAPMLSDPVALHVPPRSDLVVSIYLPRPTAGTTIHAFAFQDNYIVAGNVTAARTIRPTSVVQQWFFLTGVSVATSPRQRAATIVALGDSITDGANTTPNTNRRWPDLLAVRLQAARRVPPRGVVNKGISGNRLLHDPNPPAGSPAQAFAAYFAESALRRFDRDVAAVPGVRYVVVLLGVNDIGHAGTIAPSSEAVSAGDLIVGYRQLIDRAHERGLTIYGATITPFKGDAFGFYSPAHEAVRQSVNRWIRTSGEYDAVIDFDAALRDPSDPQRLLPRYDSGDHLHPNDAGTRAMADAVPLRLFIS